MFAFFGRHPFRFASFLHLPQSCQAGWCHEAVYTGIVSQLFSFVERQGAVAHDAHVSFQYVEQLGQFINAVFAQEVTDTGNARIVAYFDKCLPFFFFFSDSPFR